MMLNLARGFADRGLEVDLVLVKAEGAYLPEVPSAVRVVDLRSSRILTCLPGLFRYFRRAQPHALLSASAGANIAALWAHRIARSDTKVVVATHSTLYAMSQNGPNWKARLAPFLTRYFYHWADGAVAVSEGAADDLCEIANLPDDHVRVIYNPIVTPEFWSKTKEKADHPWLHSNEDPVVLAVGRLTGLKNFPLLLRAFAEVCNHREAKLIILGEGEDRERLETLVKRLSIDGSVDLPGFVDNPYAYMRSADVLVLSSQCEGFGNVIVEAMACGTSVVSTDCPSGPAEILEGGKWGRLVPVEDEKALAMGILQTIDSPQRPDALRKRARDFSVSKAVGQYLEVLLP